MVILFHGLGSYMGKYCHIAKRFTDLGYDVVGYDSYSHGKSSGPNAEINSIDNYFQDTINFTEAVRNYYQINHIGKKGEIIKFVGYGYSMGGTTAIASQIKGKSKKAKMFDALIVNAPGIGSTLI